MTYIRRSADRGHFDAGWLDSRHSFSFGTYHDPAHSGFGVLRVINEDRVKPGQGFGAHGHRDMEIVTYVLEGALAHQDSLGNGSVIRPGDVQRMSAGTGIRHSEYNHSTTEDVRFLQIWIEPQAMGVTPGYEQRHFDDAALTSQLRLVASPSGTAGSVRLNQDAQVYAGRFDAGTRITYPAAGGRDIWLQVLAGRVTCLAGAACKAGRACKAGGRDAGIALSPGDGVGLDSAGALTLVATEASHVLLFDLPGRR